MDKIEKLIRKKGKEKIVSITAYDYAFAKIVDEVGFDFILVGDSLAMVVLGYDSPIYVTMDDMLRHTKAVARGAKNTLIVGDMPAGSYDDVTLALKNARAFVNAGAHAVKIEGPKKEIIEALVNANIPVMGHLGLTPQTIHEYKVQGREKEEAERIKREAKLVEEAGAFAVVLECIPEKLGEEITRSIKIPTIGIGAGRYCDGQILVIHDVLGLYDKFVPKFAKQYINFREIARKALQEFKEEVLANKFPEEKHVFK